MECGGFVKESGFARAVFLIFKKLFLYPGTHNDPSLKHNLRPFCA